MIKQLLRGLALSLATGSALAASPGTDLRASLEHIAQEARPGTLGILVMDPVTGDAIKINDGQSYLMMSVFKAPVAAAVLDQVDKGKLSLDQKVHLTPADIVSGSAVPSVGERLKSGPMDFTIDELLHAAVTQSDNTAVDALIRVLGGGKPITAYLEGKGVHGMRIDMGERDLGRVLDDLKPGEQLPDNLSQAEADRRLKKGFANVMARKLNLTTLDGAASFLRHLQAGDMLSAASTKRLLDMMTAQVIPNRIRAGLPAGFQLADKTGTGPSASDRLIARNDIGIVTAPDGRKKIVVLLLSDARVSAKQADAWFAEVGRLVARSMQ